MKKKKRMKWEADTTRSVAKGYGKQHFTSSCDDDELVIETTPWGEGDLEINGKPTAHVDNDSSAYDVFRELEDIAENIERGDHSDTNGSKDTNESTKNP